MAILVFLVIITIIMIVMIKLDGDVSKNNNGTREVPTEIKEPLEREKDVASFYLIDELIGTYFSYITNNKQENNDFLAAYSILNENFIKENNITPNNIETYFEEYKGISSYRTKEVYKESITKSEGLANQHLYVKGIVRSSGIVKDVYIYMIKDLENNTYNIAFISEEDFEKSISDKENNTEKLSITINEYNKLHTTTSTERIACLKHMQDYKNALMNNEEEAYNLLDKEYREKRFPSLNEYKEYRKKMQAFYGQENFTQYLVNNYEDYREYVCKDQYGNLYIFEEEYPMEYTLKLDTYTIMTEKFKKEYNSTNAQKKVVMNVEKWVQMLNSRNYKEAYNLLDKTFRESKWETFEEFEEYMYEKYPLAYQVEYGNFENNNNTYIQEITLLKVSEDEINQENLMTIVMQLKDDYQFVMSFGIE